MSAWTTTDRTLALAGVFQAAWLTHAVAHAGEADAAAVEATLASLYRVDAPDTAGVFGGVTGVHVGLHTLGAVLGLRMDEDMQAVMRYALGLLHFERRADRAMLTRIATGCAEAAQQSVAHGPRDATVYRILADTWTATLGTLEPRIIVRGRPGRLQEPAVAAEVRAILLGGFRAAVLWRQVGGSRWSLLLSRGALRAEAARLLAL